MLGCAHSAANPLTAHFGVAHGEAVGRLLSGVIRRNCSSSSAKQEYLALAASVGLDSIDSLLGRVGEILDLAEMSTPLHCVLSDELLSTMAGEAASQWTAAFNPVHFEEGDFEALYREVLQ